MLNLDTRIPLQVQERDYGRGFDTMQQAQMNQLKLQALRDKFDEEKAEKLRQKQMRQGMASELQKMQQGTPAQYNTTFPQTMPTGQMPSGMSGVLANERGQNMPQPAMFGENILEGNFDINREMVSPAVAGRTPDLKDYLDIQLKTAIANQDPDLAFDAFKKLKELEKNPNKYFGGLTKGIDPKTNKPLFLAMTETGVVPVDGYQPYEEPLTEKEKFYQNLDERKFRAEQDKTNRQLDLDYKKYIADLNKPAPIDPVEKAGAIADIKADAAVRKDLIGDAANVVKTYNIMSPMINSAISIVKNLPPDMLQSKYQSMLAGTPLNKYLGNPQQQQAITDYNLMLENLRHCFNGISA